MWRALALRTSCKGFIPKDLSVQSRGVSIYSRYRGPTISIARPNRDKPQRISPNSSGSLKPMDYLDGPLVWIDCEMTGLDHREDILLEIAVIITNGNLEPIDEGIRYVIRTERAILDGMDEWCTRQHGQSGLTQACLDSPHSLEDVSKAVLQYVKQRIPKQRIGVLAGNSVHCDRMFLTDAMPELLDWLHYRIVDVSSIKELARRWYGQRGFPPKTVENTHRALDDIRASIQELQWYRENIFVSSQLPARPKVEEPLKQDSLDG